MDCDPRCPLSWAFPTKQQILAKLLKIHKLTWHQDPMRSKKENRFSRRSCNTWPTNYFIGFGFQGNRNYFSKQRFPLSKIWGEVDQLLCFNYCILFFYLFLLCPVFCANKGLHSHLSGLAGVDKAHSHYIIKECYH